MEAISGSSTAVYTGCFGVDYILQLSRDPENPGPYTPLSQGLSMLANRLSWCFNLQGPSVGVDSACSSTAMALDMGCRSLRDGSCETVCTWLILIQTADLTVNSGFSCWRQYCQRPRDLQLDVEPQFPLPRQ